MKSHRFAVVLCVVAGLALAGRAILAWRKRPLPPRWLLFALVAAGAASAVRSPRRRAAWNATCAGTGWAIVLVSEVGRGSRMARKGNPVETRSGHVTATCTTAFCVSR